MSNPFASAINPLNAAPTSHQQIADAMTAFPRSPEEAAKQQMLANLLGIGTQTNNVLYRQLLQSYDPRYLSQVNQLAAKLSAALNGNIPLQFGVMTAHTGTITRNEQTALAPTRTLNYYFPQFFYLTQITATVLSPRITEGRGPTEQFGGQIDPMDYVSVRIRREQNQRITFESAGTQTSNAAPTNDYLPLSHVAGNGKLPYTLELLQLANQGSLFTIDVQIADDLASCSDVQVSLHGLLQPMG